MEARLPAAEAKVLKVVMFARPLFEHLGYQTVDALRSGHWRASRQWHPAGKLPAAAGEEVGLGGGGSRGALRVS